MRALALVVVVLLATEAQAQEIVRGAVRDQQDRAVGRAAVELSCARQSFRFLTGDDGVFSFAAASAACDLIVRRRGFDPWRRTLEPPIDAIAVVLTIAPLRETVNVAPSPARDHGDLSSSGSSARMSASELAVLGPDSQRWIELVMDSAGAFVGQRRIYVDGLPASSAPAAARISHVAVNGDPFSAEFGGVDQNRIDITTAEPDRRWRFDAGGPTWQGGGGDALLVRPPPDTRRRSAGVSGPVPHLPATFFAQGSTFASTDHPTYLTTQPATAGLDAAAAARATLWSWSGGASVLRSGLAWQAAIDGSHARLDNAGIGGLTAPAAGLRSSIVSRRFVSSWKTSGVVVHRGGVMIDRSTTRSTPNAIGQARTIYGQLNTSGNDLTAGAGRATRVHARHVIDGMAAGGPWSAGIEMTRAVVSDASLPNPHGRLHLETLDATHGTLILERGAPTLTAAATTGALFIQATPVVRSHVMLRAGARGDWQAREGLLLSPRATMLVAGRGFIAVSRAGLFVEPLSAGFLLETRRRDGLEMQTRVIAGVPPSFDAVPGIEVGEALVLRMAPGLARRRDVVVQTLLMRKIRRVDASLDHKWTRGIALAGTTRSRQPAGLIDLIDSDRRLDRHQLHARAAFRLGGASATAHYEWVHSRDDSQGPFALPARQQDLASERGQSTGVAVHNASLVASLTLRGAIRAFLSASASSGSPYSIVTGRDPEGLSAFTDRGGARRHSMPGPPQRSVSVYASRQLKVPRGHGLAVDVGIRADNVFDWTNVTAVGQVAGSSWLGQPLTALAGRSFNVWASVAR